ncbi:MAG: hypothetical protein LBR66_01590 [Candidatus Symbiothrix sp.]|jgi:hypothetical protein|nr:hypothetical protein [Candidatus Symbiothrix sp.]
MILLNLAAKVHEIIQITQEKPKKNTSSFFVITNFLRTFAADLPTKSCPYESNIVSDFPPREMTRTQKGVGEAFFLVKI